MADYLCEAYQVDGIGNVALHQVAVRDIGPGLELFCVHEGCRGQFTEIMVLDRAGNPMWSIHGAVAAHLRAVRRG